MYDTDALTQAPQIDFLVPPDKVDFSVGTTKTSTRRGRGRPRGARTDRTLTLKLRCTPNERRLLLGLLAQVHLRDFPQERPAATILCQAIREYACRPQLGGHD